MLLDFTRVGLNRKVSCIDPHVMQTSLTHFIPPEVRKWGAKVCLSYIIGDNNSISVIFFYFSSPLHNSSVSTEPQIRTAVIVYLLFLSQCTSEPLTWGNLKSAVFQPTSDFFPSFRHSASRRLPLCFISSAAPLLCPLRWWVHLLLLQRFFFCFLGGSRGALKGNRGEAGWGGCFQTP